MKDDPTSVSFERDIKPLFTSDDIDHMEGMGVLLADHAWMSQPDNAKNVYEYLTGDQKPRMPPGGPFWDDAKLNLLADWIKGGYQP
jgi:hypothetical protein